MSLRRAAPAAIGPAPVRLQRRRGRSTPCRASEMHMTLSPNPASSRIGAADLEYRMIGPPPDDAPTIVMLHEGLGSAGLWGDFPDKLQAATGAGVFAYSRAGYGASSPVKLPRPLDYMHIEALDVLPKAAGRDRLPPRAPGRAFRRRVDRGDLCRLASGSPRRALALIAPHFIVEDISVPSIAEIKTAYETTEPERRNSRAGTRTSTTPSTAGTAPGSIRNSATGIFRNISPTSACPSRSCRARTTSMGRCARSRSPGRNAIARST